ncbi:MAG TPA: helix-turn-helix domain-containing protein [Chitinophaga sp.]
MLRKSEEIPFQHFPFAGQISLFRVGDFQSEITHKPHRHAYYHLIWFTQARGKHMVDFKEYEQEDNTLFVLHPGQVHQVLEDKAAGGNKGWAISFTEKFYFARAEDDQSHFQGLSILHDFHHTAPIRLSEHATRSFHGLVQLMEQELQWCQCKSNVVKQYLTSFLTIAERERKKQMLLDAACAEMAMNDHRTVLLRQLLEKHFRQEHQAGFYANEFALTPKRLNEISRENTGKTVTELLHERLMLEAKRNLAFSNVSVKEICYDLGFEDPAYFSRFFKHHTGVTPQDFREKMFK